MIRYNYNLVDICLTISESQSKSFSMNGSTGSSKTASNSVRAKILSAPFSSKNLSKSLPAWAKFGYPESPNAQTANDVELRSISSDF